MLLSVDHAERRWSRSTADISSLGASIWRIIPFVTVVHLSYGYIRKDLSDHLKQYHRMLVLERISKISWLLNRDKWVFFSVYMLVFFTDLITSHSFTWAYLASSALSHLVQVHECCSISLWQLRLFPDWLVSREVVFLLQKCLRFDNFCRKNDAQITALFRYRCLGH